MATSTYLANPVVTVNAVALTGFCTAASMVRTLESIDQTSFGETSRTYTAGLANNTTTMTLFMTYGAAEVYATLKSLVGTRTTVTMKPGSGANSPTSPLHTMQNCYLEELPVLDSTVGELSTIELTFTGGTYSETVA